MEIYENGRSAAKKKKLPKKIYIKIGLYSV
jgi:hypothetical protein